jgi:hypothetical protein
LVITALLAVRVEVQVKVVIQTLSEDQARLGKDLEAAMVGTLETKPTNLGNPAVVAVQAEVALAVDRNQTVVSV